MTVIGNMKIVRFGVSVTYDANPAANRVLEKKELSTVGKQVQFLLVNLRYASNLNPGKI